MFILSTISGAYNSCKNMLLYNCKAAGQGDEIEKNVSAKSEKKNTANVPCQINKQDIVSMLDYYRRPFNISSVDVDEFCAKAENASSAIINETSSIKVQITTSEPEPKKPEETTKPSYIKGALRAMFLPFTFILNSPVVKPALDKLWGQIKSKVAPVLGTLASTLKPVTDFVSKAISWGDGVIGSIVNFFSQSPARTDDKKKEVPSVVNPVPPGTNDADIKDKEFSDSELQGFKKALKGLPDEKFAELDKTLSDVKAKGWADESTMKSVAAQLDISYFKMALKLGASLTWTNEKKTELFNHLLKQVDDMFNEVKRERD